MNSYLIYESDKTSIVSTGQAGFIIKSKNGQLLAIDLYLSDCVERIEGHVGYKRLLPRLFKPDEVKLDVVIATHSHKDHFDEDSLPILMMNEHTRLLASLGCEKEVQRLGIAGERTTYVKPGDKIIQGEFTICFIKCDHGQGAPDAVGVVVTVDGKKIIEVGDTCLREDWYDYYASFGPFDVMIAPINGMYGNLNERECAILADVLKPNVVIPCHYGMFASHMGSPGEFFNIMTEDYPSQKFCIMTQGEKMVLSEELLFEGRQEHCL